MLVNLSKTKIDELAEASEDRGMFTIALYRAVFPDFEERDNIEPPFISHETSEYIARHMRDSWPQEPGVAWFGYWLNYGFSVGDVPPWQVRVPDETA